MARVMTKLRTLCCACRRRLSGPLRSEPVSHGICLPCVWLLHGLGMAARLADAVAESDVWCDWCDVGGEGG